MDSKVKSIDEHLYNPARTEHQYVVTNAKRLAPRTSLRYRLSKLNQPGGMFNLSGGQFNPHMKLWAIVFLAFGSVVTGGVLAQGPAFHFMSPNPAFHIPDPDTNIWQDNLVTINDYNFISGLASVTTTNVAGCSVTCRILAMNSNSTNASVVLSKSSVGDLGIIASKEMRLLVAWNLNTTGGCCGMDWGFYLTRNSTLPNSPSYNPISDINVALFMRIHPSAGSFEDTLFLQRDPAVAITNNQIGCSPASNCFIDGTSGSVTTTEKLAYVNYLNFTGTASNAGGANGASNILIGEFNTAITISNTNIPWFRFQGETYYIGFWIGKGGTNQIDFFQDGSVGVGVVPNSMILDESVPNPAVPQNVPPTIDTGGFFGPVIRALISIGVFILQNILSFASFLWGIIQPLFTIIVTLLISILASIAAIVITVIKAVLNAIGTGLGIPALGDNLFTFLGDIAAFFTTFFGNSLAQLSSFITFLTNGYSTISASFGTYWTDLTNWTSGIKDLLAGLWIIGGQLFSVSFALMFSGWLLFGAKKFSDSVGEGMEWFNLTRQFVMIGVALALFLFTMILHYVIIPVFHAVTATGEAKQTAEPDVVIGGTGVG